MLDVPQTPLKALLKRRRPGYTLEAPFYTSPEIFAADMETIFHRHWIYVAVEADVPEPGDVHVVEIGGTSVLRVTFAGDLAALAEALRARGWQVTQGANALAISR